MFAGIRTFAQSVANGFMDQPVTIRHKLPFEKDPEAPYGDDTIKFEDETTTVLGWMVSNLTKSLDQAGGMADVAEQNTVRLPVGTRVNTGDELTIADETWTVIDTSSDETWPAMLKASLQRAG